MGAELCGAPTRYLVHFRYLLLIKKEKEKKHKINVRKPKSHPD